MLGFGEGDILYFKWSFELSVGIDMRLYRTPERKLCRQYKMEKLTVSSVDQTDTDFALKL